MKRYGTLLQLTTCLALGGTVMVLWLCVLIGFGIHTTVGKEGIYLWLLLQAVQLTAAAAWLRRGGMLGRGPRTARRCFLCVWCGGAAALLFSLCMALAGLSYGSAWVSLPCTIGTVAVSVGWSGQFVCLCIRRKRQPFTS